MTTTILQKQEKEEVNSVPQRIRRTAWKEPKRKHAPTWDIKIAARYLGFKTPESVRILLARGPEHNGLQGYIYIESPDEEECKWIPKHGTGYTGVKVLVYPEDVKEWDKNNLRTTSTNPHLDPSISDTEKQEILDSIEKYKREHSSGMINRSQLQQLLVREHGTKWSGRKGYHKLKRFLDENGYPLLPGRTDTSTRRQSI